MKKNCAEYWAPRINAEWRKSVEGVLGAGRQLIAAKEACKHGDFLRLFKGHDNVVSEPVPFSENTAQRLMAVASHEVLSNAAHVQHLPQAWGTLYELTKLEDEQIVAGIKAGEITADMTRSDAHSLRSDLIAQPETPAHEEMAAAVKNAVTKFLRHLTTAEQYSYVRIRIEQILEFLAEVEKNNGIRR